MSDDSEEITNLGLTLSQWGGLYRACCGKCFKEERVPDRAQATRQSAGTHFHKNGWRMAGDVAICPVCRKLAAGRGLPAAQ